MLSPSFGVLSKLGLSCSKHIARKIQRRLFFSFQDHWKTNKFLESQFEQHWLVNPSSWARQCGLQVCWVSLTDRVTMREKWVLTSFLSSLLFLLEESKGSNLDTPVCISAPRRLHRRCPRLSIVHRPTAKVNKGGKRNTGMTVVRPWPRKGKASS